MKIILIKMDEHSMFMKRGWGNGYVVLDKTHPLFGKDYDDIGQHVEVHGGITFTEYITKNTIKRFTPPSTNIKEIDECCLTNDDLDKYLVGFDTAHLNDTEQTWPVERVFEEAKKLKTQLENYAWISKQNENI